MKKNTKYKLILLVLVPYLAGEIINRLLGYGISLNIPILMSISTILLYVLPLASVVFWFWVGRQFGSLKINKIKSFILANLLWFISLVLYIWQFIILDGENRSFLIAGISQNYMLGFINPAGKIIGLFTNKIDGRMAVILAYIIMIIVFTIGFISRARKSE